LVGNIKVWGGRKKEIEREREKWRVDERESRDNTWARIDGFLAFSVGLITFPEPKKKREVSNKILVKMG